MAEERKRTALEDRSFKLVARSQQQQQQQQNGRKPSPTTLNLSYFNNTLSLGVFLNDGRANFNTNLTAVQASEFLETIKHIARGDNSRIRKQFRVMGYDKAAGKQTQQGLLMCGRDESGIMYIAVKHESWEQPMRFDFKPAFQFRQVTEDGVELTDADVSSTIAYGWSDAVLRTYTAIHVDNYNHPQPQGNRGGYGGGNRGGNGGYGNNNRNNNNGGGYNSPANASFDDDIQF